MSTGCIYARHHHHELDVSGHVDRVDPAKPVEQEVQLDDERRPRRQQQMRRGVGEVGEVLMSGWSGDGGDGGGDGRRGRDSEADRRRLSSTLT